MHIALTTSSDHTNKSFISFLYEKSNERNKIRWMHKFIAIDTNISTENNNFLWKYPIYLTQSKENALFFKNITIQKCMASEEIYTLKLFQLTLSLHTDCSKRKVDDL